MSEPKRCPWCDRPRATPDDWHRYDGGQGEHLCWADPTCEMDGDEKVVVAIRAENEMLRGALRDLLDLHELEPDRPAVRYAAEVLVPIGGAG